jgi:hypothetical protein
MINCFTKAKNSGKQPNQFYDSFSFLPELDNRCLSGSVLSVHYGLGSKTLKGKFVQEKLQRTATPKNAADKFLFIAFVT